MPLLLMLFSSLLLLQFSLGTTATATATATATSTSTSTRILCDESTGLAGIYPCKNVGIESIVDFETLTSIGGSLHIGSALTEYTDDGSPHQMCQSCNSFDTEEAINCETDRIQFFLREDTCSNPQITMMIDGCAAGTENNCTDLQQFCSACEPFMDCLFANDFDLLSCLEFYIQCDRPSRRICSKGTQGADIWGFSQDGRDFVATCLSYSTAFLDVTDASDPKFIGYMPVTPETSSSMWCDIKIIRDANDDPLLYKVSEAPGHGVQVLNLARLQNVTTPQTFTADYTIGNSSAHNIAINEDSGMVYIVGQRDCPIGMTIFNPRTGLQPGCFGHFGYVHDADCVVYRGPDTRFQHQEICVIFTPMPIFQQNGTLTQIDGVQIISVVLTPNSSSDVSFQKISGFRYPHQHYPHQGWFSEDHRYLIFSDELDELEEQINTTTYIYDLMNLSTPVPMPSRVAGFTNMDHNLYFFQGHLYQSDYSRGLRVFDFDPSLINNNNNNDNNNNNNNTNNNKNNSITTSSPLTEIAYLETSTNPSIAGGFAINGAWSSYQFEPTNGGTTKVVISTIDLGVFIVTVNLEGTSAEPPTTLTPSGVPTVVAPTTTVAAPSKIFELAPLPLSSFGSSSRVVRDNVIKLVSCLVGVTAAAIVMGYL